MKMGLGNEMFAEIRSFDSAELFPNNRAASFLVQFDREIRFEGQWAVALRDMNLECPSEERPNMAGQNLYIYTNIINFSFVGGSLKQLLLINYINIGICTNKSARIIRIKKLGQYRISRPIREKLGQYEKSRPI